MSLKVDVTIHAFVIYKGMRKAAYSYNNFNVYILYALCILYYNKSILVFLQLY